ncbi:hypothetical protein GCM10009544_26940 [Streptomyces stramineus]|uniref:Uncharacterized protein n=1 Tax=Streptomyces stramineus TaxID=173861 RepID=A0ABN0ZYY3_9ACTN
MKEPSSFSVESSTTGVPKYRMLGVMVTWSAEVSAGALSGVRVFMGPDGRAEKLRRAPKDPRWMMDGDEQP